MSKKPPLPIIKYYDLKIIDYLDALKLQKKLFQKLIDNKKNNIPNKESYILSCEHSHVYTLGKHGNKNNLLINNEVLKKNKASFYDVDRGGDITYHGPGQIVIYPIFDLTNFKIGIKEYVNKIEQSIINTVEIYGIKPIRIKNAPGIWINNNNKLRKICAIGIKASHNITMHGLALNVNTNLDYFNNINPCGFIDRSTSSLQNELNRKMNIEKIKAEILDNIGLIFNTKIIF